MLGALSLRFATRSLVLSRTSRYRPLRHHTFRTFSTTPRRLAEEVPEDFINAIKDTALYKKLAERPSALKALSDFYDLTKEMGIDINSKGPPSPYRMFKLVTNPKFSKVARRAAAELEAAGFTLDTEGELDKIMKLALGAPRKKDGP